MPELWVANRLRRLYPLDTRFPSFPPAPLRIASEVNEHPMKVISPSLTPESARQAPPKGNFSRQSCRLSIQAGGFPRGKQSARRALPCVPLVVCLNSGSLTAFGGCIHWIPASLRSPLHPFGSPTETIERPIGLQVLLPRRSRRVKLRQRGIFHGKVVACCCKQGGFPRGKQSARFALPCVPLVVCLNSGALTAFGGCAHWVTVNFSNSI